VPRGGQGQEAPGRWEVLVLISVLGPQVDLVCKTPSKCMHTCLYVSFSVFIVHFSKKLMNTQTTYGYVPPPRCSLAPGPRDPMPDLPSFLLTGLLAVPSFPTVA
jgi:hypothetical protein